MDDNCIISKYDYSEREAEMKKRFLSTTKKDNVNPTDVYKYSVVCNKTNNFQSADLSDENINKLVEENFNAGGNLHLKSRGLTLGGNSMPDPQLNVIYNQNRILERNVDICQETQRILHDFLKFNIVSQSQATKPNSELKNLLFYINEIKGGMIDQSKAAIESIIKPVLKELEDIKTKMESTEKSTNSKNKSLEDIKQIKSQIELANYSVSKASDKIAASKQQGSAPVKNVKKEDNLKSQFDELVSLVKQVESNISDEVKKFQNVQDKNILKSVFTSVNPHMGGGLRSLSLFTNQLEEFDYTKFKNEIVDLEAAASKIALDHKAISVLSSKPGRSVQGEKINFSYKLDFEDEDQKKTEASSKHKKTASNKFGKHNTKAHYKQQTQSDLKSSINIPNQSIDNVFLNNMSRKIRDDAAELPYETRIADVVKQTNTNSKKDDSIKISYSKPQENQHAISGKPPKLSNQNGKVELNLNRVNEQRLNDNERNNSKLNIYSKNEEISRGKGDIKVTTESKDKLIVEDEENTKLLKRLAKESRAADSDEGSPCEPKLPSENSKQVIMHDIITKLVVDKLMTSNLNKGHSEKQASPKSEKLPFPQSNDQLKKAIERLLVEKLKEAKVVQKPQPDKFEKTLSTDKNIENEGAYQRINNLEILIQNKNDGINKMMEDFIFKIDKLTELTEKNKQVSIPQEQVKHEPPKLEEYVEQITNMVSDKLQNKLNININLPHQSERREETLKKFVAVPQKQAEIEIQAEIKDEVIDDKGYNNPFDADRQAPNNFVTELPIPYLIDFNEYDLTSSCITISRTNTQIENKSMLGDESPLNIKYRPSKRFHTNLLDSVSEGQIISHIDNDHSYMDITSESNSHRKLDEFAAPNSGKFDVGRSYENHKSTTSIEGDTDEKYQNPQLRNDNLYSSSDFQRFKQTFKEKMIINNDIQAEMPIPISETIPFQFSSQRKYLFDLNSNIPHPTQFSKRVHQGGQPMSNTFSNYKYGNSFNPEVNQGSIVRTTLRDNHPTSIFNHNQAVSATHFSFNPYSTSGRPNPIIEEESSRMKLKLGLSESSLRSLENFRKMQAEMDDRINRVNNETIISEIENESKMITPTIQNTLDLEINLNNK